MSRNYNWLNHIRNSSSMAGMNPSGYPMFPSPGSTGPVYPIPVITTGKYVYHQRVDPQYGVVFSGNFNGATSSRRELFGRSHNDFMSKRFFSSDSNGPSIDTSRLRTDKRKARGEDDEGGEDPTDDSKNALENSFVREIYDLRTMVKNLRKWEHTQFGKLVGSCHDRQMIGDGIRFTFMNYNILSQHLLASHRQLYSGCDPRALDHAFRKQLFFSELDEVQPDIITLQEVEETEFYRVLEPTLFLKGFKGVYKKRTGDKIDGCAIFYRATRFGYLDKLSIEFQQPHIPVLNRDNVALFLKLRCNKQGPGRPQTLVVGTTHILFNPKRQDVKMAQVQLMLTELDRFAFCGWNSTTREPVYHPMLLAGDFNSDPHTALIKFITEGVYRTPEPEGSRSSSVKRSPLKQVLPPFAGISDQCQHYKLMRERLSVWKSVREDHFKINSKVEPTLINIKLSTMNITNEKELPGSTSSGKHVTFDSGSDVFSNSDFSTQSSLFNSTAQTSNGNAMTTEFLKDNSITSLKSFKSGSQYSGFSEISSPSASASTTLPIELDQAEHNRILEELADHEIDCTFGTGELSHNLRFSSVYAPLLDRINAYDLGVTTKHVSWTSVDYIFYSKIWNKKHKKVTEGNLRLIRRLGLLSRDECKRIGPIPNLANSSDHYCLVAEFVLK